MITQITYLGMRYYVEIYTIVHILWGQAWKKSFSGKKRKLLTFHVQYLWRVVHYDITVTWPEVQNGGPRAAGSQVSMIHNFLILYPILLKFSLVCLNKVQLYYRSNFPLGLPSPLRGNYSVPLKVLALICNPQKPKLHKTGPIWLQRTSYDNNIPHRLLFVYNSRLKRENHRFKINFQNGSSGPKIVNKELHSVTFSFILLSKGPIGTKFPTGVPAIIPKFHANFETNYCRFANDCKWGLVPLKENQHGNTKKQQTSILS